MCGLSPIYHYHLFISVSHVFVIAVKKKIEHGCSSLAALLILQILHYTITTQYYK